MILRFFILLFCLFLVSSEPLPYAEWAHYHMVWLSNEHSNQNDIQAMFDGYVSHEIPFGTVNIDSTWATNFNTFAFNSTKFPTVRNMLDGF
jgi:alpha-glucosidase (family GH31 glycosyl hydrolase)